MKIEKYKTTHLIFLILIVIIVVPPLLCLPAINHFFNFSNTGNIGETIGGITSPFINGLAAVLVFIAFKAQIKANDIIVNQDKSRNILNQITLIQEDKLEIEKVIMALKNRIELLEEPYQITVMTIINKIIYFTAEIRLAYDLIEDYTGEKEFLYRKLYYLYEIRYKEILMTLGVALQMKLSNVAPDYEKNVIEILFQIKFLNEKLSEVNPPLA